MLLLFSTQACEHTRWANQWPSSLALQGLYPYSQVLYRRVVLPTDLHIFGMIPSMQVKKKKDSKGVWLAPTEIFWCVIEKKLIHLHVWRYIKESQRPTWLGLQLHLTLPMNKELRKCLFELSYMRPVPVYTRLIIAVSSLRSHSHVHW